MRLAVGVEDRGRGVATKADGACLVGAPGYRDVVGHIGVSGEQMVRMHPKVAEVTLDATIELVEWLPVVLGVGQHDVAFVVEGHPVVGQW